MERHFHEAPPEMRLSDDQRTSFYERMRSTVVLIRSVEDAFTPPSTAHSRRGGRGSSTSGRRGTNTRFGSGVLLRGGLIVTSAQMVPTLQTRASVEVRRFGFEDNFRPVVIEHIRREWDLALLQVRGTEEEKSHFASSRYCTFGDIGSIQPGKEVFSICHSGGLLYSFTRGEIVFPAVHNFPGSIPTFQTGHDVTPTCRVIFDMMPQQHPDLASLGLNNRLPIIQINQLNTSTGACGGPVFDSTGRLIGIIITTSHHFDFAVHLSIIGDLVNEYEEKQNQQDRRNQQQDRKGKGKASQ